MHLIQKKKKKAKKIRVLSAIILNGVLKLNNYFKTYRVNILTS